MMGEETQKLKNLLRKLCSNLVKRRREGVDCFVVVSYPIHVRESLGTRTEFGLCCGATVGQRPLCMHVSLHM